MAVRRPTTFVLVHGAWHDSSCWDWLTPLLMRRGHRVIAPDLPCDDPAKGFEDYAAVVRSTLSATADAVVVGHSLGSETIRLLDELPHVRTLVYLCPRLGAMAQPPGSPEQWATDLGLPRDALGRTFWDADAAVRRLYPRLAPEIARRLADRLRPQADVLSRPYPQVRPPRAPSSFVYTADDELFRPEWARWAARSLLGVEPIELPGGHFPMAERPLELADVLCDLAGAAGR